MSFLRSVALAVCAGISIATSVAHANQPATSPSLKASKRHPAPSASSQAAVLRVIREAYAKEYDRLPSVGANGLANTLIAQGEKSTDVTEKYVLLQEARDLAVRQRLFAVAFRAIEALGRDFEVDLRRAKLEALREGVGFQGVANGELHARQMIPVILGFVDESLSTDDYPTALSAVALAEWVSRTGKTTQFTRTLNERVADVKGLQEQFKRYEAARMELAATPDDAGANLIVGKYLAFAKDDFERGLPLLAKGSDSHLRALSQASLNSPSDAAAQFDLGDRWRAYAERSAWTGRRHARRYAATWYRKALPNLTGLEKALAEKRIAELAAP